MPAPADPGPLVFHAPSFRIGFDGDGAAAGGELVVEVDVAATAGTGWDFCDRVECWPCPDDGDTTCLRYAGVAWTGDLLSDTGFADLPACEADFTKGGLPDCEDGGGTICMAAGVLLMAPALRRRRR